MRILLFLCMTLQFLNEYAFAQWIKTPGPHGADVRSIALSPQYQFAGTTNGLYRAKICSSIWESVNFEGKWVEFLLADGNTVYAGTYTGLYFSNDNGASWNSTNLMNKSITTLIKSDSLIIAGTTNGVFKSTDNGWNWSQIDSGLTSKNVTVLEVSEKVIFVGTLYDGLYKSTDSGKTWILTNFPENSISALYFNGTDIFASYNSYIYRSSDQGSTWTIFSLGGHYANVTDFVSNGKDIYAASYDGVYKSLDNGETWHASTLQDVPINNLALKDTLILAGAYYGVYKSTNNGDDWTQINTGLNSTSINELVNSNSTLFAGTDGNGVFASIDNGTTWIPFEDGLYPIVTGLGINGDDLFAGTLGGIYHSYVSSPTWHKITDGFFASQSFIFKGDSILASSDDGVILSIDNGITWQRIDSIHVSYSHYQTFALLDIGTRILAGYNQKGIRVSNDNGLTWNYSNNGISNITVNALSKIGDNIVLGTSGAGIYYSSNGGSNWVQSGLTTSQVMDFFVSGNTMFACGSSGVYKSKDCGLTWINVSKGLPSPSFVISVSISGEYIFAGLHGSGVWRRPLSEVTNIVVETLDSFPNSVRLFQNYPNPFNPETTISFDVKEPSSVILKIYNINGQLICTLVNKRMQPGRYKVPFKASDITSGIYFYQIQMGNYQSVKKMVLLE